MIEMRDVHKAFRGNEVLRGVDLSVPEGETLVVLGRSGTGKSVTLKHVVGLLAPDRGEVTVAGRSVVGASLDVLREIRSDVAYMFQTGALVNWMSVRDNVALPLVEARRLSRREIDERVDDVLASVGLTEAADLLPGSISGGMRKRAALCRVLVLEPKAILYDEPTAGLDPIMSNVINDLILEIVDGLGATALSVTSDMAGARRTADRIAMMHQGKILWQGPLDGLDDCGNAHVEQFINKRANGPIQMVLD